MEFYLELYSYSKAISAITIYIVFIIFCGLRWLMRRKIDVEIKKLQNEIEEIRMKSEKASRLQTCEEENRLLRLADIPEIVNDKEEESLRFIAHMFEETHARRQIIDEKDVKIFKLVDDVRSLNFRVTRMQGRIRTLNLQLLQLGGNEYVELQDLIEHRREEKEQTLRENLKNQLEVIHARIASEFLPEPFPEGTLERLTTNNLWNEVFEYLTDSSDVSNVALISQVFANIIDGRRKLLLLPEVLNVFKINAYEGLDFHEALGVAWFGDLHDICSSFRSVSQTWKRVADYHWFDSNFVKDDWFLKVNVFHRMDRRSDSCSFIKEESVHHAASTLIHSQTPIQLIRNVYIWIKHRDTNNPFYTELTKFLTKYGREIWFFQCLRRENISLAEAYEILLKLVECMPNLKGMEVNLRNDIPWRCPRRDRQNFLETINDHPFPSLDSLEHLRYSGLPDVLLTHILEKCVNLRSVGYLYDRSFTRELTEALLNLRLERYEGCLTPIIMSGRYDWPLKHLQINQVEESLRNSDIFSEICSFRGTLEELYFTHEFEVDPKDVRLLQLPKLKVLGMESVGGTSFHIDDLLQLVSLEKLILGGMHPENENSKVKMRNYLLNKEMEKSNVWECFPNLRLMEICVETFYRPGCPNLNHSSYNHMVYRV